MRNEILVHCIVICYIRNQVHCVVFGGLSIANMYYICATLIDKHIGLVGTMYTYDSK